MKTLVALLLVVGIVAAGCGSGDTSDSSDLAPKRDKATDVKKDK